MSKQKQFLKPAKNTKKKIQIPETDDEYLAAGVKEEEAGEKWRAGDAAKSCRFFLRAIDLYDTGLRRHPTSFDLAYNKARLQYDVSQQPRLLPHQPLPLIELLYVALESHRYALALQPDDADVLFNTAQVMVSIAEALIDNTVDTQAHNRSDATPLLQDAIRIFQKCLSIQLRNFQETDNINMDASQSMSETGSSTPSQPSAENEAEEQWASVVEPVTLTTLLDTCLAEVHAWTTLLPLLDPNALSYQSMELDALKALDQATDKVSTEEERIISQQAGYNLKVALADYAYRSKILPSAEYAVAVSNLWSLLEPLHSIGPALCDHADSLITLSISLASEVNQETTSVRWQALSTALKSLANANGNPGSADRVAINARRGDVELLRTRLGDAPISHDQAAKNRNTLLKNAETYYDGARKLAMAEGDTEISDTMAAKTVITRALRETSLVKLLAECSPGDQQKLSTVVGEMVEEGLLVS